MALPHPKSGKDNYREGHVSNDRGVIWKFFKRTINITNYRNAKDNVDRAKNQTFGGISHDWVINQQSCRLTKSSSVRGEALRAT